MKKQWKNPALEILMRVFYGIALISGAVLMKGEQSCVFAIAHKIGVKRCKYGKKKKLF